MAQWFGPKTFGYGIGPRSWQGWLATVLFAVIVIGSRFIPFESFGLPDWSRTGLLIGTGVIFALTVFLTYERDPS